MPDYMKRLNSTDYWDDIAKLKNSGFIELKDEKAEITESGKKEIKEMCLDLQKDAKAFLEENYRRNLIYE